MHAKGKPHKLVILTNAFHTKNKLHACKSPANNSNTLVAYESKLYAYNVWEQIKSKGHVVIC